jgi:hypothetical protein
MENQIIFLFEEFSQAQYLQNPPSFVKVCHRIDRSNPEGFYHSISEQRILFYISL